jgi:hypothetical protein
MKQIRDHPVNEVADGYRLFVPYPEFTATVWESRVGLLELYLEFSGVIDHDRPRIPRLAAWVRGTSGWDADTRSAPTHHEPRR